MTGHIPTIRTVAPGDIVAETLSSTPAPEASIIVAVHNAAPFIDRLLEQLGATQHSSFEVILVDDGSTDSTIDAIRALTEFASPMLVLSLKKNVGVAAARNLALRHARGRYLWLVDGDDQWNPDALRLLCEAANKTKSDMVIAQATRIIAGSLRTSRVPAPRVHGDLRPDDIVAHYLRGDIQGQLWNKLFARHLLCGHGDIFPRMP